MYDVQLTTSTSIGNSPQRLSGANSFGRGSRRPIAGEYYCVHGRLRIDNLGTFAGSLGKSDTVKDECANG